MSGSAPVRLIVPLTEKLIVSAPNVELACWMAARRVQLPLPSLQTPSCMLLSAPSPVELTVNVVAAYAVGWRRFKSPVGRASRVSAPVKRNRESVRRVPGRRESVRGILNLLAKRRRERSLRRGCGCCERKILRREEAACHQPRYGSPAE